MNKDKSSNPINTSLFGACGLSRTEKQVMVIVMVSHTMNHSRRRSCVVSFTDTYLKKAGFTPSHTFDSNLAKAWLVTRGVSTPARQSR